MTDMESRKFEDSFKKAFEEAEVSPSDSVWTNIALDLEKADGGKVRRRLLFYKTLAAASVLFAMAVAGAGYYMFQAQREQQIALRDEISGKNSQPRSPADGANNLPAESGNAGAVTESSATSGSSIE